VRSAEVRWAGVVARNSIVKIRILMIDIAVSGSQKATLPDIPATVLQPQTSQAGMQ
jgi:hypothetical protein